MQLGDWAVIAVYVMILAAIGYRANRTTHDHADYYVGGRTLSWWALGISSIATQTSAISFISIPAYVALKRGGGLTWAQYELAVPLAIIVVMAIFVPYFRKLELISVYEYLEGRFGPHARSTISLVFLINRGLGTAVGVYATALVLEGCLGLPLWLTILLIGGITLVYDYLGGIKAVVHADVVAMTVLLAGLIVCIVSAVRLAGGLHEVLGVFPVERLSALDYDAGVRGTSPAPFWSFLVGGFFLYVSYYGVDQVQAQRGLSATSVASAKSLFALNGFVRFPLTALYMLLGMSIAAVYARSPALQAAVPVDRPDLIVPEFVRQMLPTGLRGLVFAALMAAAISSLDSALNALSAVAMRDFITRRRTLDPTALLRISRYTTLGWGIVITVLAFIVGGISDTVIESINKVGSAFYGPILGAFAMGILSKRARSTSVVVGVICGVVTNIFLAIFAPTLFWMWWNATGFAACVIAGLGITRLRERGTWVLAAAMVRAIGGGAWWREERTWLGTYGALGAYFVLLLAALTALTRYAGGKSALAGASAAQHTYDGARNMRDASYGAGAQTEPTLANASDIRYKSTEVAQPYSYGVPQARPIADSR